MACFFWGIGILGGLFLLGWFLCFIDNEKTKSRRTYLESGSVGKSELRNRAKLFLKKQKVGETSGVISQRRRTYTIDMEESLLLYDRVMSYLPHDHHLACLICDYLFYLQAFAAFESLSADDRGFLNARISQHSTNVFYARSRVIYRLSKLKIVDIDKGRAKAGAGWLSFASEIDPPFLGGLEWGLLKDLIACEWDSADGKIAPMCVWEDSDDLYDSSSDHWDEFWNEDHLWSHTQV